MTMQWRSSGGINAIEQEYADDAPSEFGPFMERAERFVQSCDPSLDLLMREWRATRTDKTTDLPWIVVMETYLRRR